MARAAFLLLAQNSPEALRLLKEITHAQANVALAVDPLEDGAFQWIIEAAAAGANAMPLPIRLDGQDCAMNLVSSAIGHWGRLDLIAAAADACLAESAALTIERFVWLAQAADSRRAWRQGAHLLFAAGGCAKAAALAAEALARARAAAPRLAPRLIGAAEWPGSSRVESSAGAGLLSLRDAAKRIRLLGRP